MTERLKSDPTHLQGLAMHFRAVRPAGWPRMAYVKWLSRLRPGSRGPGAEPVGVPMRELGGGTLEVRPGTTDLLMAVLDYELGMHDPPAEVRGEELRRIVEIGANTGNSLVALAHRYPSAQLLGVEPDAGNVAMARRNVARFGERVSVERAAIWETSTDLAITGDNLIGYVVEPARPETPQDRVVRGLTIDDLLAERMPGEEPIDFVYLTGVERRVLDAGGEWVGRTRSIRVELQPQFGYDVGDCVAQLEGLGFRATFDTRSDRFVDGVKT